MSAGLTEEGALLGGVSRFAAGQERGALFRANENVSEAQVASEFRAGSANENIERMKAKALEGQQVAQIGASGVQQAGSPSAVVASTAAINEMNALQIRNNAARRAWGFAVQGESDRIQAGLARQAGTIEGIGTILGGTAKAYQQSNR